MISATYEIISKRVQVDKQTGIKIPMVIKEIKGVDS